VKKSRSQRFKGFPKMVKNKMKRKRMKPKPSFRLIFSPQAITTQPHPALSQYRKYLSKKQGGMAIWFQAQKNIHGSSPRLRLSWETYHAGA